MEPAAKGREEIGAAELEAIVREVRERVRARYPQATTARPEVPLADLMPLVHARDAAEAKVAAIGTVNPRPGGLINALIQTVKRLVARALDWHVREQVEFNRGVMASIDALIESLNEVNRSIVSLAARTKEGGETNDLREHWSRWHNEWERKLAQGEMRFLRAVAELQGSIEHQHSAFGAALQRAATDIQKRVWVDMETIQKRLWADMEAMRVQYERVIHTEVRLLRLRAAAPAPLQPPGTALPSGAADPGAHAASPEMDSLAFAARFRGSDESVRERQRFYLPYFSGCKSVLDIGCGRGEFLELLREAGVAGRGIDLSRESVDICRAKGLEAEQADLYAYLASSAPGSLDGIFCGQVVEHLPPARVPELVRLAAAALAPGGLLAVETPNPECLAIFAVHFFLDPTHVRPVPHPLLAFYFEEAGFGSIEVHKLSPAIDSMPELAALPAEFRDRFFGGQDYAILGRRL